MGWLEGIPHDRQPFTGMPFDPDACVMHRTIGRWAGDYAVLTRGRVPSVHFLVGQNPGQWVQFYDTATTCAHAAGANSWAVGIEFSGQNSDVEELTDWQIEAGGRIVSQLRAMHDLPGVFLETGPRVTGFSGFLNHSNIETAPQWKHYDFITKDAWERMTAAAPPPPPPIELGEPQMILCENNDAPGEFVIVTSGGLIPCPKGEAVKLRKQGRMADADKVGEWVLEDWKSILGGKIR